MADSIIVNVSELRSIVQDIRRSGADLVELSISDPETINGEQYPATLNFSGCKSNNTDAWTDFDPLEAVENNEGLQRKALEGIHMSSNLF